MGGKVAQQAPGGHAAQHDRLQLAAERHDRSAAIMGGDVLYMVEVEKKRAADPHEWRLGKLSLEASEQTAYEMVLAVGHQNAGEITLGHQERYLVDGHASRTARQPDVDASPLIRMGRAIPTRLLLKPPYPLQGDREPVSIDGLQEVVERRDFECLRRVAAVPRDENDGRPRIYPVQQVEAVPVAKLDIQKDGVRLECVGQLARVGDRIRFPDDLGVRIHVYDPLQATACAWFIIDQHQA